MMIDKHIELLENMKKEYEAALAKNKLDFSSKLALAVLDTHLKQLKNQKLIFKQILDNHI